MYRLTIRIRSNDTIRPNTNTLFGPLFGTEANIRYIPTRDGVLEDVALASRPDDGVLGLEKKLPVLGFRHESKVSE